MLGNFVYFKLIWYKKVVFITNIYLNLDYLVRWATQSPKELLLDFGSYIYKIEFKHDIVLDFCERNYQ